MELVAGSEKLVSIFGDWPSFHDSEVVSILLTREARGAIRGPTILITIHLFEMTNQVDSKGLFTLRKHVLVTLALFSAEVLSLDGFNLQNVLDGLIISRPEQAAVDDMTVQVELCPEYGVAAKFQAARAEVLSVEPFEPAP